MDLGAVSHFNQGWPVKILPDAVEIGVDLVRDGVSWSRIEVAPGEFRFEGTAGLYPEILRDAGIEPIVVFGRPRAHVDGGETPHTDAGRAAFAEFVAAVLERFPSIGTIEIGNEFNGDNFVSGPVETAGYTERAGHYVDLLRAVHDRVADAFPDVRILGGATHSVPVGYLRDTFELGALELSDGIAVHPYTSVPEELGEHLAILRDAMGDRPQPIYVTEFGQAFESAEDAPAYLAKMVAVMSAAGVEAATWYALREQRWFPNMELMGKDGVPTPAGESFAFMQDLLGRGDAVEVSPDELTRAFRFGDRAMMLWGAAREVELAPGAAAYTAAGKRIAGPLTLGRDEPVVVVADGPIALGRTVRLGETAVVGDSFLQFDVTNAADGSRRFEGPWSWHELRGDGRMAELVTMEGGSRKGEVWRPYLGGEDRHPILVHEQSVRPVDYSDGANPRARYAVVERFTASEAMTVTISGEWDVSARTRDGVDLTILAGGREVWSGVIEDERELTLGGVAVAEGEAIDFVLGTNRDSHGDLTRRHIQILREGPAPEEDAQPAPGAQGRAVVAEVGRARVGDRGVTVELAHDFEDPVVIASVTTAGGADPVTARVSDVAGDRFELVLDEPDHLDGALGPAAVSWIVVEAGRWTLGDGTVLEAGLAELGGGAGPARAWVDFAEAFAEGPALFAGAQTMDGPEFVWTQARRVRREGFEAAMTEEEATMRSVHARETVGWLAIERGAGHAASAAGTTAFEVSDAGLRTRHKWKDVAFEESFAEAPHLFGGVVARGDEPAGLALDRVDADGARLRLHEDRSLDAETGHGREAVHWMAIADDGLLFAA